GPAHAVAVVGVLVRVDEGRRGHDLAGREAVEAVGLGRPPPGAGREVEAELADLRVRALGELLLDRGVVDGHGALHIVVRGEPGPDSGCRAYPRNPGGRATRSGGGASGAAIASNRSRVEQP